LTGLRILEVSSGRVARIAGMLLADLGADVVAVATPGRPANSTAPEDVCWGRGKRQIQASGQEVAALAGRADAILIDATPADLSAQALDSEHLQATAPDLVHVWLPPYGEHGEWRDLPEDPLLLAALSALAVYLPADDTSPVAPVTSPLTYLHAILGAAATVAALVGRDRLGYAQPAVVTGLHAGAALMGTAFAEINGKHAFAPSRAIKGPPNWRIYECADSKRIFLGALTPDIFFRALEALGRLDVMALPEVAGDFQSILDLSRGRKAATAVLEPVFASRTSDEWLALLSAARVPTAPVATRAEWMNGPVIADNDGRIVIDHPSLGAVTMPNLPIACSETPGHVRGLLREVPTAAQVWPASESTAARPPAAASLPLQGLRVLDVSSFLAAPMVAALLAEHGADVVRVEPPVGDAYRNFPLAFLAVNQRKRGMVLDLRDTAAAGTIHAMLAETDVLVENLRPRARAQLQLGEGMHAGHPRLVQCSVSAFGRSERFADLPGFDQVLQVLNGMAVAQGGDGDPIVCGAPVNDVSTGALGALGVLAALFRRHRTQRGQRVWVSLAAASTFIQSGEFTQWDGSPEPQRGRAMFRGPAEGHRYYECSDGWIAAAAIGESDRAAMLAALNAADFDGAACVLRDLTVAQATSRLNGHGVPACRVVPRHLPFRDPFLQANGFSHPVASPDGVATVVDRHSRWPAAPDPRASRYFDVGEDTEAVLGSLGIPASPRPLG
jgi:crotonobetainyl-CoA:carnitine CoA-transferase CaiB-like acyl-CoA transferase